MRRKPIHSKSTTRAAALLAALALAMITPAKAPAAYIAVDLTPSGYHDLQAWGASGGQQVGDGVRDLTGTRHAMLWSGTAASAVDLNPSGFSTSYARGIGGTQQVGYA